jgi:hypothetical protein
VQLLALLDEPLKLMCVLVMVVVLLAIHTAAVKVSFYHFELLLVLLPFENENLVIDIFQSPKLHSKSYLSKKKAAQQILPMPPR